ncbi:MAG: serine hydrolase domain-containing protein [Gemmatimonadales bacterium]
MRRTLIPALILLTGLPALVTGQAAPVGVAPAPVRYAGPIAASRALLLDSMRVRGVPGASVAVLVDGRLVWSEGLGWADLEQRVPVTPLTRFRIGSVSKSLTAAAVGLLWQEGRLDLDAPVQTYVPSFPVKRWPVTTREAAGHLAGIRHYRGNEFLSQRHYDSVVDGLAIFQNDTLLFEPGTRYSYSTYGWSVVSAVVEGAAHEPFLRFMRERVLEPLGLDHTVAEHPDSIILYRTRYYTRDGDGPVLNAPWVDNSYKWAGGGYLSTTEDLVRYGAAWLEPGLLADSTLALLTTAQHTRDGKSTGYGLGWNVRQDERFGRVISHSGGSVGGTAFLVIYPDRRAVFAILANTDVRFVNLIYRVADRFLSAPPP